MSCKSDITGDKTHLIKEEFDPRSYPKVIFSLQTGRLLSESRHHIWGGGLYTAPVPKL